MVKSNVNKEANRLTTVLFIIYLIALYWILLLKLGVRFSYMGERRTNLVPFSEPFFTSENILNVFVFVPLGIYIGVLFEKYIFGKKIFIVFFFSLLVEGLQFILRVGAFDITDIITNTFGGIIGLMIVNVLEVGFSNHVKAQRFINLIAATGTGLIVLMLVLLKMNMLPVRYQ